MLAPQAAAPNTFQAVHTLVAFKVHDLPPSRLRVCLTSICGQVVAAEFHHRVHMYQDQGFFTDILVAGANFAMEEREHELAQYFNVNKSNKKTSPGLDRSHPKSDGCDALAAG